MEKSSNAWHEFLEVHLRNKEDDLEAFVCSLSRDITGVSETWWNESCDWNAGMECYRLYSSNRQGKKILHYI